MAIYVFGSLNMDLVSHASRLPVAGETILGQDFATVPGGKGANQAVAAARLGYPAQMVGRVGPDGFGQTLLTGLQTAGVGVSAVGLDPAIPTGVALIVVAEDGQNQIVVVPGANGRVDQTDLARLQSLLHPQDYLLLQFEIPVEMVVAAAQMADQVGVTVMLDPAPVVADLPASLYPFISILTPNQGEASQLTGLPVTDLAQAQAAATWLQQRGVGTVVIKLGATGALVKTQAACWHQPALPLPAVDTVGAGDAFNGGLAVALAEGLAWPEAVRFATATAAWSVTRAGAQVTDLTRDQVADLLKRVPVAVAL